MTFRTLHRETIDSGRRSVKGSGCRDRLHAVCAPPYAMKRCREKREGVQQVQETAGMMAGA
ncbi:MAG: hypothetical protein IJ246_10700 [Clostridia bacterium]|nr:hypothetical protein [Clostridia bacterium]